MGAHFVVVASPGFDDFSSLGEISKPMFVEAFVSELTIETLHIGILDGFPGFDETLLHPGALRPFEHGSAGQLRAVVMNEFFWITVDGGQFIEIASEALAGDGGIDDLTWAFSGTRVNNIKVVLPRESGRFS